MKIILLLTALLYLSPPAYADSVLSGLPSKTITIVASGGSPIPIAYSASDPQSRIISGLSGYSHLEAIGCASAVTLNHLGSDVVPVSPKGDLPLPVDYSITRDGLSIGESVYLKSATGSPITSCTVVVTVW